MIFYFCIHEPNFIFTDTGGFAKRNEHLVPVLKESLKHVKRNLNFFFFNPFASCSMFICFEGEDQAIPIYINKRILRRCSYL